jgi:aspartate ammonia-lyase
MSSDTATRLEHDSLGEMAIPATAYYGIQTQRALENFHISGIGINLRDCQQEARLSGAGEIQGYCQSL